MPITITTPTPLPPATVGVFYSATLNRTGGTAPFVWNAVPPAGLLLIDNNISAIIQGTPTTAANPATFDVFCEEDGDDFEGTIKNFSLVINPSSDAALVFGNTGDKVSHGSGASLDNLPATGAFSGWAWIYKTAIGGQQCIITKDNNFPSGWMFLIDGNVATGLLRFIIFRGNDFSNATNFQGQTLDVLNDEWTFVGFRYDGAATPRVKLYRGKLDVAAAELPSYNTSLDGTGAASDDAAAALYVGNDQRNELLFFKGRVARGGVVPVALTLTEFENIRRAGLKQLADGDIADHALIFDYKATGTQTDYSGNGNTGTSSGVTASGMRPDFFQITTQALPMAPVGLFYNQTIAVIRGSSPFSAPSLILGNLPAGLSMAAENTAGFDIAVRITGTPNGTAGISPFTISVPDFNGIVATKSLSIEVIEQGDLNAPTVPTGLAGTVLSTTRIDLSWNASTDVGGGVTGYDLQRATDAGFTTNLVTFNLGNVLNYSDTGRTQNTRYYYRIRAHDAIPNNSAYSAAISRATLPAWEGTKTFAMVGYVGLAAEDNFAHVISGGFEVGPIYYYRSSDEGSTWGIDGVVIANGIPYLEDPLVIQDGKIALFYFKNTVTIRDFFTPSPNPPRVVGELYCTVSVDNGVNWQTEKLVSGVVVPGRGLRMSACWTASGTLHATWMDFKNVANPQDPDNQTTSWDLYYNRSLDNGVTWETEQRLAISSNKTGENRPSVVALGDTVHLTWFRGIDNKGSCFIDGGTTLLPNCTEVFHQRNQNNGTAGSWETRNQLTSNFDPILYSGRVESVAIEPSTVLITFDRGLSPAQGGAQNDIYGIRTVNNGLSFQAEFPIIVRPGAQTHSGTAFRDGRTHLVWGSYPNGGDNTIYYIPSFDDGVSFGIAEVVTNGIVGLIDTSDNYVHCVGGTTYRRRFLPPPAPDTEPPTDVGIITPTVISSSRISLDWADAADDRSVTNYLLQIATDINFTNIVSSGDIGSNVSAKLVTNLSPSTAYFFRVKAKDGAGNYSVNWSPAATATTLSSTIINVGNVLSYQHTDLSAGSTHSYRVRAYDPSGNRSEWTTILTRTTT